MKMQWLTLLRNTRDLAELAHLVDQGVLKPRLGATLSLAQAKRA